MRISRIRRNGEFLTSKELQALGEKLVVIQRRAGFETDFQVKGPGHINLGLHMRSFNIIPSIVGYNAKIGINVHSKKGYKRTRTPLWEEREEYNHNVNDLLDSMGLKCNITSGAYKVRNYTTGRINEWNCVNYMGEPSTPNIEENGMGITHSELMKEVDARELLESDSREKQK